MKKLLLSAVILLLSVSAVFSADGDYIVLDVEGQGRNRSAAIEDAWLEGIRQAVGSFIDSKTELNDNEITERIIAYSRGLVEKYEITGVDDSRAGEGIYKLKMRVWVAKDLLKDGVNYVTGDGMEMSFSRDDIEAQKREELDAKSAKELESKNSLEKTREGQAKKGVELLSAMLERYKPEDFLICRLAGKPKAVKGKEDIFEVPVEVTFNDKLYREVFVPDLEKVLDQISVRKKDTLLLQQKDALRKLNKGEALTVAKGSIILQGAELGKDYSVAVYDKPEHFGCRLYGFKDGASKIINALDDFLSRAERIDGFRLELQGENKNSIYSIEQKSPISLLLSKRGNDWALHPTLLMDGKESSHFTVPLTFEMPVELLDIVKGIKVSLILLSPEQLAVEKEAKEAAEQAKIEAQKRIEKLNSVYGGKSLGDSLTAAQCKAIRSGTFDGMALGDYWTINGVNWRIADFDYLIRTNKIDKSKHHLMIVPDKTLYNARMNSTDTTSGGYAFSEMHKSGLDIAKKRITKAFGTSHILTDYSVELMTKEMAFGTGNEAFSLFRVKSNARATGKWYWLQDVVSVFHFALVNDSGSAHHTTASRSGGGVRPVFAIY